MSYYRLYRSKDDILIQHFNEIFAELLNEIKNTEGISKYQFSLLIFQQAKENERLLKAILLRKILFNDTLDFCHTFFHLIIKIHQDRHPHS